MGRLSTTVLGAPRNAAAPVAAANPHVCPPICPSARCIGEGFSHVSSHVNFAQWFGAELAPLLTSHAPPPPPTGAAAAPPPAPLASGAPPGSQQALLAAVLTARALWLLGVCGGELPASQLAGAYQLCIRYLAADDSVVSGGAGKGRRVGGRG